MARKDSLDARADEILRILDETPETPATRAAAALAQARDAGDGALRQQHVQEAQAYIAQIDLRDGRTIQKLQAQVLALQGRGGDTRIAHVTPGEIVVPLSVLTPDLRRKLAAAARDAGIDPRSLIVGSNRNAINPRTGQMEFTSGDAKNIEWSDASDQGGGGLLSPPVPGQPSKIPLRCTVEVANELNRLRQQAERLAEDLREYQRILNDGVSSPSQKEEARYQIPKTQEQLEATNERIAALAQICERGA